MATIEDSLTTPDRLLAGAERLVVREGVRALTVRRIAEEAGVNSALVRYHFGDTDGLLGELALRNAARLADARVELLKVMIQGVFADAVDALIVPLWARAAMNPRYRAIVVLDEVFSRSGKDLNTRIWAVFADGVARVQSALEACLPGVDPQALAWRIRFVTAAALDIPPRGLPDGRDGARSFYGADSDEERLAQFRRFALDALQMDKSDWPGS
ncbi:MAG: TetR/AcrR family transcriptional regulator [Novosphingobium sp.]